MWLYMIQSASVPFSVHGHSHPRVIRIWIQAIPLNKVPSFQSTAPNVMDSAQKSTLSPSLEIQRSCWKITELILEQKPIWGLQVKSRWRRINVDSGFQCSVGGKWWCVTLRIRKAVGYVIKKPDGLELKMAPLVTGMLAWQPVNTWSANYKWRRKKRENTRQNWCTYSEMCHFGFRML